MTTIEDVFENYDVPWWHFGDRWYRHTFDSLVTSQDKSFARDFLSDLTAVITSKDEEDERIVTAFIDSDEDGINFAVALIIILYLLRDEIIDEANPLVGQNGEIIDKANLLVGQKELEWIVLTRFVRSVSDADQAWGYIDYIQGWSVEDGAIDNFCSMIDAVLKLRNELITGTRRTPLRLIEGQKA